MQPTNMDGLTGFFLICAGVGGLTSLVRMGLQFLGSDDGNSSPGSETHDGNDAGFRLLSLQGIAYFLLMFGLVGAALHAQSGLSAPISAIGATASGVIAVVVISGIFKFFTRMQSSGNVHDVSLVGCTGSVYQRIPPGGSGLVTVKYQNRLRELAAIGENGAGFESGDLIRVVAENQGIITVQKLGDA